MKLAYLFLTILFIGCIDPASDIVPNTHELSNDASNLDILVKSKAENGIKLEAYWKLFKKTLSKDQDKAMAYLDEQLALAQVIGNTTFEGLAYHGKGLGYKYQGQYNKAIKQYLLAVDVFKANNDKHRLIHNINNIGSVFMQVYGYDAAIEYFDKALEYYQDGHPKYAQTVLINLATSYRKKQQPDYYQSESYYLKAIKLQKQLDHSNHKRIAYLYNEIGALNFQAERYPQAITAYYDALTYAGKMDEPAELKTNLYINLAESALKLNGDYPTLAGKWIKKALALSPDLTTATDKQTVIKRYNTIGTYYQQTGNHEQALGYFTKAVRIANKRIINKPLQETLNLINVSHEALMNAGARFDTKDLFRIEKIEDQQYGLEKSLAGNLNNKSLADALKKEVTIHQNKAKAAAERHQLAIAWQIVGALAILLLVGGYFIVRLRYLKTVAENKYKTLRGFREDYRF